MGRLVSLTGQEHVQHPEHGAASAGPDGVFTVDEPLYSALRAQAGQWMAEEDYLAEQARRTLEELRDPRAATRALAELHGRVPTLEARIEQLEQELAALRGGGQSDAAEAKPARTAKKTAAKPAAAKPAE